MRDVFFMVTAFFATAVIGLSMGAMFFFLETGRGLHPVPAGVIALLALVVGFMASGEIGGYED